MAAMVSPSPVSFANNIGELRRPLNRAGVRSQLSRTTVNRSPVKTSSYKPSVATIATTDSSDDEDLAPIKLSAEAQAILGEEISQIEHDKQNGMEYERYSKPGNGARRDSRQLTSFPTHQSPNREAGSPVPRVVRVTSAPRPAAPTTLARDGSFMYKIHDRTAPRTEASNGNISETPASRIRHVHVSGSRRSSKSPPAAISEFQEVENIPSVKRQHQASSMLSPSIDNTVDEDVPAGPTTVSRPRRNDDNAVHSTMRVRRIGTGTFLSRPIRRGMIRRQSEEDEQDQDAGTDSKDEPEIEMGRRAPEPDLQDFPDDLPALHGSPQMPPRRPRPRQEVMQTYKEDEVDKPQPVEVRHRSVSPQKGLPTPISIASHASSRSSSSNRKPIFKIPSIPPLVSEHDQENDPPPTFRRAKPSSTILEASEEKKELDFPAKPSPTPAAIVSIERPALAARSNNTPHRPAPAPPPKMSLIDAATSNAGSRNKKSVHYILNGRTYRRLDCIGRGGSSRVFRVMAENYKTFAIKRVNLEDADMAAIAGYKGEIDLLKKLENVDRVIRLYDYEINEDKGILSVMMELGESNFNDMLNIHLKADNARLDITFTRHYWKEMLECVQSVHNYGIVHSDLKPANFVLVKGQLKLIDFGIANAIQDDTVNVHRENQIGTPNYMSPESLVCHTPAPGSAPGTKLLKIGRPSDVWSLGCILYQMTYGQPPFAHIQKQFERIMSIPNPKVEIQFPSTGIGGAVVPFGLIKTLRRCLTREQTLRPTIAELLSDADPFLNPVAISPDMLGRVIGNVITHCRRKEMAMRERGESIAAEGVSCLPRDEDMIGWPLAFYEKLRQAQEEGTAW